VKAAKAAADAAEQKAKDGKVASLTPAVDKSDQQATVDVPRSLQSELRRVGCNTGAADGNWNAAAQKSLDLFNKHSGLKLDVKVASTDALDAVKSKSSRICPLICDHGFKPDGDRCTKITCRSGHRVGDDNTCEEIERPIAKREEPQRERRERAKTEAAPARPEASGKIVCGTGGCRPVQKGCRLEIVNTWRGSTTPQEVCN
jgi:hypothetical protein